MQQLLVAKVDHRVRRMRLRSDGGPPRPEVAGGAIFSAGHGGRIGQESGRSGFFCSRGAQSAPLFHVTPARLRFGGLGTRWRRHSQDSFAPQARLRLIFSRGAAQERWPWTALRGGRGREKSASARYHPQTFHVEHDHSRTYIWRHWGVANVSSVPAARCLHVSNRLIAAGPDDIGSIKLIAPLDPPPPRRRSSAQRMHIQRLALSQLRRFDEAEIRPGTGINLVTGENGAGKTSVLEALHLMAYGRSFRGRVRDGLVRNGQQALDVFVEWSESGVEVPRIRRAGLRHGGNDWTGRLDGVDVQQIGTLCAALAVVTFEPGSHALVSGGSEPRRRFLDWGLFHVEPDFLMLWRRYARALKQRNALLKQGGNPRGLDAWDHELAESGEPLTRRRLAYVERLQARAITLASELAPTLGLEALDFLPGWRRHDVSLADALLLSRERDRTAGYTSVGPHRADWASRFTVIPGRDALSRGQAKLTALVCLLAQAEDYAEQRGEWPVIALDDLASELDRRHQGLVLHRLSRSPAQIFITATESLPALENLAGISRFHVEHGRIAPLHP